jgi:ribonuclease HII
MKKDYEYICGVDEAGRGPLAGPMSLAFFVVKAEKQKEVLGPLLKKGLNDSKKLSHKKREELYKMLNPKNFVHSHISAKLIDRYGISKCLQILIKRLLKKMTRLNLDPKKTLFLLDGSLKMPHEYFSKVIIGGDGIEPTIMAASIVSKVRRDRRMKRLALKYPKYGFEVHKGYGTTAHRKMIKKHGLSKEHRRSFCKALPK